MADIGKPVRRIRIEPEPLPSPEEATPDESEKEPSSR